MIRSVYMSFINPQVLTKSLGLGLTVSSKTVRLAHEIMKIIIVCFL
jgi:hypothetical protein